MIVDYLQRITPAEGAASRNEEVAIIARGLKSIAKDCRIPVLALCQLNRASEKREDRKPILSDLRDSGEIEQEADNVLLLHRPDKDKKGGDPGRLEMDLAKSRNTATGYAEAYMDMPTGRVHPDKFACDVRSAAPDETPF